MGFNTDFVVYKRTLNVSCMLERSIISESSMTVKFLYLEAFQQQSGPQFGK